LLGTGDASFGESCPSELDSGCDSEVYALSDGLTAARPLPTGFKNVQWTPDGAAVIGNLADGRVTYVSATAPVQPRVLGRGGFVLPRHW
jgi:hypothetical protein